MPLPSVAGLYVCTAESWCGSRARSSGVLEVEPRQPPVLQLHPGPGVTTTTGGSVMLQCRCGGGSRAADRRTIGKV